ncbi:uncharacterized protein [Ambystoma mexicanum]|uniref:uncharacterized protein n=1 Tax=Ambystoma mexicanum TaxID=8296 RepID=UPI0037E95466
MEEAKLYNVNAYSGSCAQIKVIRIDIYRERKRTAFQDGDGRLIQIGISKRNKKKNKTKEQRWQVAADEKEGRSSAQGLQTQVQTIDTSSSESPPLIPPLRRVIWHREHKFHPARLLRRHPTATMNSPLCFLVVLLAGFIHASCSCKLCDLPYMKDYLTELASCMELDCTSVLTRGAVSTCPDGYKAASCSCGSACGSYDIRSETTCHCGCPRIDWTSAYCCRITIK